MPDPDYVPISSQKTKLLQDHHLPLPSDILLLVIPHPIKGTKNHYNLTATNLDQEIGLGLQRELR